MKLLADTHAFLWLVGGDPQLSQAARTHLEDANNEILLSLASIWEMAIKVSTGKLTQLTSSKSFDVQVTELLAKNGISLLPISFPHAARVATLPFHHRDPFDRSLAAQTELESLSLISADTIFDEYGIQRIW